tara:strand:+ start:207 stop:521 length:315 start_codon:yes stop_codon:yes gene_type:complete
MIIFVDIDDTICYYEGDDKKDLDYNKAKPYYDRIKKINEMYDCGNTIVYWTARGTKTGIKWFKTTLKQLNDWGVKFHELRMGKPNYDIFIDDKNINSEIYFNDI